VADEGELAALAAECAALSGVLRALPVADFSRPTNCPPWDLAELVVHIGMSISVAGTDPPPAAPGATPVAAAGYYRRPDRGTPRYRQDNVDSAQAVAATALATTPPAAWFDQAAAAAVATLSRQDLRQVIEIGRIGPMTLAGWVATRVMSVAAHGLDVALTLGRPPWTTPQALRVVTPVLTDLLGTRPPAPLGWDDLTLLATGTGRRPLTAGERAILGAAQHRFPLLS
jgi:uncharacterized protein (TIGR03083 family)